MDATLDFTLSFELVDEVDRAACDRIRGHALSLLHAHGLGPAHWEVPEHEHDWAFGPQLHEGMWWERPIRARVMFTERLFRMALHWCVPLPRDLCAPIVRFVRALHSTLPDSKIAELVSLRPTNVLHRSPPPDPRTRWTIGSLLDILDPSSNGWAGDDVSWKVDPTRGYERQVPPPGWRELEGTTHILRWARDPLTSEEIQRAVLAQEDWLIAGPDVAPLSADAWNELGDRYEDSYTLEAHVGIQAWDPLTKRGMEQLDVRWDGTILDEPRFAQLAELGRSGMLPDGEAVSSVAVICQSRRSALVLAPRATREGLRVVYRRGASLWDPQPPGFVRAPDARSTAGLLAVGLDTAPSAEAGAALLHAVAATLATRVHVELDMRPMERLPLEVLRWNQTAVVRSSDATLELLGRDQTLIVRVRHSSATAIAAYFKSIKALLPACELLDETITGAARRERNTYGDARIATDGLVSKPPLTAYDFETGEGHQALAITDDGATGETLLAELLTLRQAGAFPDGHPVTSIVVIATSRTSALAFAPRARSLGLRVAYLDDDRELWEVT